LEEFKKKKAAKAGVIPVTTTTTTAVATAPPVAPAPKPPTADNPKQGAAPGATSYVSDTVEVRWAPTGAASASQMSRCTRLHGAGCD
jgi:hypothetical protein